MKVTQCKTNRQTNPLGWSLSTPRLSWVVEDTTAKTQTACQVTVAGDCDFKTILFDSGKGEGNSVAFPLPIDLTPRTRYYWKVKVWADNGDVAESDIAWFETGKMNEGWKAQWITPDWPEEGNHPVLAKVFTLDKPVCCARIYACGFGVYELHLNGEKVGDEQLAPFCNAYDQWIQSQTYDVTAMLKKGDNCLDSWLGNGWYKGRFGLNSQNGKGPYGDDFGLIAELHITFEDGTTQLLVTDTAWTASASQITDSSIYDGETYDANADWKQTWPVKITDLGTDLLQDRLSPPVRIIETIKPVSQFVTPKGELVIDMGQNMVGWLEVKVNLPKGAELTLNHFEVPTPEGNVYRDNLRSAKAEYHYISDGNPAVAYPRFTFYGFRYVQVVGLDKINLDDFTGCVVHSDMQRTGILETSNKRVNRLIANALWGMKGNFLDVPTDCPQRDERLGWTGDAQVFAATACYQMDTNAFFHKYGFDLWQEQLKRNGGVPHVVPSCEAKGRSAPGGGGPFGASIGSAAWADAATIIPWTVYVHFGDVAILEQQFDSMKAWVDAIKSVDSGKRLWDTGFHFGDWLAQDNKDPDAVVGATPQYYVASAYYAYSATLVAKAAKVLGKEKEAAEYAQLAEEVRQAIRNEYVSPSGRLGIHTQTANVVALYMDLMLEQDKQRTIDDLSQKLAAENNHLTTGFVGTPYLCRVLSDNGLNEQAYSLLMKDDFPSWLYAVDKGATTIWERWNSIKPDGSLGEVGMNSFNHYSYGSVVEWMYRNMVGLNPCDCAPGFKKAIIKPLPYGMLQWAHAKLDTAMGLYECGWKLDEQGKLTYKFVIPFNATADVTLPDAELAKVTINGAALTDAQQCGTNVTFTLCSGSYEVVYQPTKEYLLGFSVDQPLMAMMENKAALAILQKHLPMMGRGGGGMMRRFMGNSTLREMANHPMARRGMQDIDIEALDKELKTVSWWKE